MSQQTTNQQKNRGGRGARHDDEGPPPDTAITRTALGDESIARTGETASTAIAARETAYIQARIVHALQRPRVFETVRERFKKDVDRPRFAMVARFAKPQGWVTNEAGGYVLDDNNQKIRNFVRGWSIRAVESAVQAMGNIDATATTIFEDQDKEIVTCRVWDLERNLTWEAQVTVEKSVERKFLKRGQVPSASRANSYGDTVYLLPATDDEVRLKRNRLVSMTLRTLGLRAIPGDLLDEFLEPVEVARAKAIEDEKKGVLADPKAALKRVLDNFAAIGVRAADVVEYLGGRSIEQASPEQILELRIVGADVVAGNYSWRDAIAGSPYREQAEGTGEEPEDEKAKTAREKILKKLDEARKKTAGPPSPPATPPSAGATPPAAPASPPPATPSAAAAPPPREPGDDG